MDSRDTPGVEEMGALLAEMRELTGRLDDAWVFGDVPQDELDAWKARKAALLGRINQGALL